MKDNTIVGIGIGLLIGYLLWRHNRGAGVVNTAPATDISDTNISSGQNATTHNDGLPFQQCGGCK